MRLTVLLTALLAAASARAQFDFSDVTYMANMPTVSGGGVTNTNLLLDIYTGAYQAYSFRQLTTNATLCLRVRRGTAAANTNDIGFTNGVVDKASIAAFCGSTNGVILTWYDQSGNGRHVTHPTQGNQPRICESSAVVVAADNGLTAVRFIQASNQVLLSLTSNNINPSLTFYAVANRNWSKQTNAAWPCIWAEAISSNPGKALIQVGNNFGEATAGDICSWGDGYDAAGRNPRAIGIPTAGFLNATNDAKSWLFSGVGAASGTSLRLNGTAMSYRQRGDAASQSQALQFSIGGSVTDGDFFDSTIQEVILYSANHDGTTNATGIEANIMTYYGLH